MKKMIAAGLVGLTAIGGGAAVVPSLASAQDAPEVQVEETREGRFGTAFEGLVTDGTLTQAQVDAIQERFETLRAERGEDGENGRRGHRRGGMKASLETVTEVLGLEADALREARAEGSSLAEIAEAQGVLPQTLIDALVDEANARIDEKAAERDLDEAQVQEMKDAVEAKITEKVNAEPGERGERDRGARRGFGRGGVDEGTDA